MALSQVYATPNTGKMHGIDSSTTTSPLMRFWCGLTVSRRDQWVPEGHVTCKHCLRVMISQNVPVKPDTINPLLRNHALPCEHGAKYNCGVYLFDDKPSRWPCPGGALVPKKT